MFSATNKGTTINTAGKNNTWKARLKNYAQMRKEKALTDFAFTLEACAGHTAHGRSAAGVSSKPGTVNVKIRFLCQQHLSHGCGGLIQYYRVATRGPHRARDHLQPGPHDYLFICTSYCRFTYFLLTKGFKNGGLLCLLLHVHVPRAGQ
jgi:hypothetical protein